MAKIELAVDSAPKNQKKRKLKVDSQTVEAESPSSKFKKLDISQIGVKKKNKNNIASSTSSSSPNSKEPSTTSKPKPAEVFVAPSTSKSANKRKAEGSTNVLSNTTKKSKKPRNHTEDSEHHESGQQDIDSANDEVDDGDVDYEPTSQELQAADHPENTPNIETTRQKKKAKSQKVAETAKVDSANRDSIRNLQYLRLWKSDRCTWKFHKLRQLSIQKSLFRSEMPMDDEMWDLALEYLAGSKGQSRQLLIDAAEKVINETDERINADNQQELVNEKMYTRARELLQMFQ